MSVVVVRHGEEAYPSLLAQLHDPPGRLYVRGGPPGLLSRPAIAVVGARSCSGCRRRFEADPARFLATSA